MKKSQLKVVPKKDIPGTTLTNRQVTILWKACCAYSEKQLPMPLAFAIAKSSHVLRDEIRRLEIFSKTSDKFHEYDDKRIAVVKSHALLDTNGHPVMTGPNSLKIDPAKQVEFNAAIAALQAEYADALKAHDEHVDKVEAHMDESVTLQLTKCASQFLPQSISPADVDAFLPLLTDA